MKKRLLITSIVMMLVVAVALSTATYAWFTSNASVTASTISLEAATNDADAIGIGWATTAIGTSITPVDSTALLQPAVPAAVAAETLESAFTFKTATIRNENSADVYNEVNDFTPYVWNDGTGEGKGHESFFLKNLSTANDLNNLYVWADIDGEGSELVRVAIFQKVSSNFQMVGVLGCNYTYASAASADFSNTEVYYRQGTSYKAETDALTRGFVKDSTITSSNFETEKANLYTRSAAVSTVYYGTPVKDQARLTTNSATVTNINLLNGSEVKLAAQGTIELKVFVWFDGDKLDDQTQTRTANIKLNFASSAPTVK